MRPQFRVIFTVSLGKPWLWAQSKAGIRSVAPFFHDGRRCERARVIDGASPNWVAYRAANSPRCQKPLESAHAARHQRFARFRYCFVGILTKSRLLKIKIAGPARSNVFRPDRQRSEERR